MLWALVAASLLSEPNVGAAQSKTPPNATERAEAARLRQRDKDLDRLTERGRWPRGYAEAVLEERERAIQRAYSHLLALKAAKKKTDSANGKWARGVRELTIKWNKRKKDRLARLKLPEERSPANWSLGEICRLEHLEVVGVADEQTLTVKVGGHRLVGTRRAERLGGGVGNLQPVVELETYNGVRITNFPTTANDYLAQAHAGIYLVVATGKQTELKFLGALKP